MDKLKSKLIKEAILETIKMFVISIIPWIGWFVYVVAFKTPPKMLSEQQLTYVFIFAGVTLCVFDILFTSFWCNKAFLACKTNNTFAFADALVGTTISWGACSFQLLTLALNGTAEKTVLGIIPICILFWIIAVSVLLHFFINRDMLFNEKQIPQADQH